MSRKIPERNVEFEKCVVAAYLNQAYASNMQQMDVQSFQKLLDDYWGGKLQSWQDYRDKLPSGCSDEFVSDIEQLIKNQLINSSYRTYFYNYPKGSYLYTAEESQVQDVLLYESEPGDDFERVIAAVNSTDPELIAAATK